MGPSKEAKTMSQITVRNIPDEHFEALKRIAAENKRSAEEEVLRAIGRLVHRRTGQGFGSMLKAKYAGLIPLGFRFERSREVSNPLSFK